MAVATGLWAGSNKEVTLSLIHQIPRSHKQPNLPLLLEEWKKRALADRASLPHRIAQELMHFTASIRKRDQSLLIQMRERMGDGTAKQAPEDVGLPSMILVGQSLVVRIRNYTPDLT
jgi:hypothetical protein